jgi:LL-diaminopimelate aminotransferase
VATPAFLRELVEFARSHDIAICYDNPYIEMIFDGEKPLSFLSVEGAKDVGVELNSLSKPFNMTGWRIGMALGNPDLIAAISKVKENTDSGVFNAIQYAAIAAPSRCADTIPQDAADLTSAAATSSSPPCARSVSSTRRRGRSTCGCPRRAA